MTDEQRAKIKQTIDSRIKELQTALGDAKEDVKPVEPDVAIGRISRIDSMQAQQMALEVQRRHQAELARLKDARSRVDSPSFGICPLCRKEISFDRLMALPDATLCVECSP